MDNVSFNEELPGTTPRSFAKKSSGLSGFLIAQKFAKDEKQASMIMLVVAVLAIVFAVGVFLLFGGSKDALSPQERIELEKTIQSPIQRR